MRLLLVKDNAMIGKALLQSVIDRFSHLDDGLNDTYSKLGLTNVKTFANRHGIASELSQFERLGSLPIALGWPLSKQYNAAVL